MSDRLSDEVVGGKNKPEETTESNPENTVTNIGSNCTLRDALSCFNIEDWDEVFTAKDLREIPVAKTNCIPIIPKKYRNLIKNATLYPVNKKKKEHSKGENDLCTDHRHGIACTTTQLRNIAKLNSPASEMKREKQKKSVLWNPNLVCHTSNPGFNRTKDDTIRRSPMEERRRIESLSSLAWEQRANLRQKSKKAYDSNRPPIESLIDKLAMDRVQVQLPDEKNRLRSKK